MLKRIEIFIIIMIMITLWLIPGCEDATEPEFIPQLTVNGELRAGFPIDSVYLNWSSKITERYDTDAQRISNADVRINGLQLVEYPDHKGIYYYPDTTLLIQSGVTYALEVRVDDYEAYSETTVPQPFLITPLGVVNGDTVQYVPGTTFFSPSFFDISWPGYAHSPIYRLLSIADVAADSNFIVDERTEAEVFKGSPEDRENPGIWWVADTYARVNWMFFNWTGWHNLVVSAVDSNYYNYRRGILFGEQNGQNFNPVIQGGLGLFFSSASDTLRIYLIE
jgi:hypothetical protein